MTRTCGWCETDISDHHWRSKFCSRDCWNNNRFGVAKDRSCAHCAGNMDGRDRKAVYCSVDCLASAYNEQRRDSVAERLGAMELRSCTLCGVEFRPRDTRQKKFCSDACRTANPAAKQSALRAELRAGKACEHCGVGFDGNRPFQKFCSRNCGAMHGTGKRRVLIAGGTVFEVTSRDWGRLCTRYDGRCAYCGDRTKLTRDHIIPISRGGAHGIGNLIPACQPCNASKNDRLLMEWKLSGKRGGLDRYPHDSGRDRRAPADLHRADLAA